MTPKRWSFNNNNNVQLYQVYCVTVHECTNADKNKEYFH